MYNYRQMIHRMRMGQTDREIARSGIIGRPKCSKIRAIARNKGWLSNEIPLPDDVVLSEVFAKKSFCNPTHASKCENHETLIKTWIDQGIYLTTIYRALVDQYGFTGSYSSVRRLAQKLG